MINIDLPEVKNRKGLSIYIGIDSEYAGFSYSFKKNVKSLTLGWLVIRIIKASEAHYNRLITVVTLQQVYPDLQINQKDSKMQ